MPHSTTPSSHSQPVRRRRRRRRRRRLKPFYRVTLTLLVLLLLGAAGKALLPLFLPQEEPQTLLLNAAPTPQEEPLPAPTPEPEEEPVFTLHTTGNTRTLHDEVQSEFALLADADTGEILAGKNIQQRINPASMTKILTLLVAAEELDSTEGTFTMTREVADYCFVNECSVVGYEVGEEIPVIELFYGCILCSGADACLALAQLSCGSHEAFVDKMNETLSALGLSDTAHFTNCVGVYDPDHFCTVQDLAVLMKTVLENDFCREVMSTPVYSSVPTPEHPDGQVLSNWFVRRMDDQETGSITVPCGKTGYVPQSGNCAVSYGEDETGKGYLCVTGKGSSSWQVVYDHAALYGQLGG